MTKNNLSKVSNGDLLVQLRNAERAIEKNTKYSDQAVKLIDEIYQEWNKRAIENRFEKVTDKGFSLLEYVGYHVGKTQGLTKQAREKRLVWIFESPLPPVGSPDDYFDWGLAKTRQRYNKLKQTLEGRLSRYNGDQYILARKQTIQDLKFLAALAPH